MSQMQVKVYRNVRFGLPPTGARRFMAAESPDKNFDTSKDDPADCIAVPLDPLKGPACDATFDVDPELTQGSLKQNEDCLFLDIYVPSNLAEYKAPLPVIVWFYGGAYVAGRKYSENYNGMLYSGVGAIRSAALHGNGVIFVVGNYRLGALGWLAGSYIEAHGTPNAGLTDQRLLLEFVQNHIGDLNGDPDNVSAWGESAGGGSILHHLIARNGDGSVRNPLFSKVVVQSPAYEWRWDRSGKLNDQYMKFAEQVLGYRDGNITALRNAPIEKITKVNKEMACDDYKNGFFPFGPSIDGKLIKEIPVYAFGKSGNYWKNLDSVISSHVALEAAVFTRNLNITRKDQFTKLVGLSFPNSVVKYIEQSEIYFKGPSTNRTCVWDPNWKKCYTQVAQDSMFMANVRALYQAYKGKCYMMNYRWPSDDVAQHGTDLVLTFAYTNIKLPWLSIPWELFGAVASIFQQYFVSHAISSSPSEYKSPGVPDWTVTEPRTDKDALQDGVMVVKQGFGGPEKCFTVGKHADTDATKKKYSFWLDAVDLIIGQNDSGRSEPTGSRETRGYRDEL
ncbi:hypothetical protein TWF281_010912 [Arthrobotrys megalospora]